MTEWVLAFVAIVTLLNSMATLILFSRVALHEGTLADLHTALRELAKHYERSVINDSRVERLEKEIEEHMSKHDWRTTFNPPELTARVNGTEEGIAELKARVTELEQWRYAG